MTTGRTILGEPFKPYARLSQIIDSDDAQPSSAPSATNAPPLAPTLPSRLDLLLALAPYAVACVLFYVLAWRVISWWDWEYTRPESYYSHGPLIPLMAAFMLWSQRARLSAIAKQPNYYALAALVPSLALLIFGMGKDARALESVTLIGSIWAGTWFALGSSFVRAAWFPLAFLALMMPLPGPILNDATLSLQMISTAFAAKLLNLMSFVAVQSGTLITMSDFKLSVDVPCSGFKTVLALFTFNAFLAAMLDGSIQRRVLLFVLCAPLAIVINAFRIALIGVVGQCLGVGAALVFHDYSGLITVSLGFVVLFSIAKLLGCRTFAGLAIF